MGLGLSPFAHQLFELRIAALGQHDTHGGEQVAFAVLRGKALAFEAEGAPGAGAGRNGKLDRAFERRHAHLGAEHRLVERDRKLEPQIGTCARKQRMRRDRDDDQKIASTAASAGGPLPFQPDGLAVVQPGRDLHVDLPAGGQLHALVRTLGRFQQGDGQRGGDVAADTKVLLLELETAGLPRTRGTPKRLLQNILEAAEAAKSAAAPAGVLKAVAPEAKRFKNAFPAKAATRPAPGAETLKALEARLALGVDLAAIEGLALVRLAQNFVSSVQLGKARGCLRVVFVGVWMQLLRLPAESSFDLGGTRCLRHPQDVIGVTHAQSLLSHVAIGYAGHRPNYSCSMWGAAPQTATRDANPGRVNRASDRARPLAPPDDVIVSMRFQGCVRQRWKRALRRSALSI